jgi:predicted nucleotidyltransferase
MDANVVGRVARSMADLPFLALRAVGDCSALQKPRPELVVVFGSFARGEADADSDLDLVVVRPIDIGADDSAWADSTVSLSQDLARALGNPVNILEVGASDLDRRLRSRSELWRTIRSEGIIVYGDAPGNLQSITR